MHLQMIVFYVMMVCLQEKPPVQNLFQWGSGKVNGDAVLPALDARVDSSHLSYSDG